ncbi:11468_t:CDS:2 [Diversispora eburnea]|uniref:11468_t:CDS:1 n=1 Tax=Diversispora eburnea TaxID=1213867 RepID=A0A9N9FV15_9GLOM|nr:11468_t:CDS:2 [Diversispora eburnea]
MSTENWEEINELDFEDDLAHRITVHSVVHHLNVTNDSNCNEVEELEYQLVQAHKQPTYAAAAKWGIHKKNKKSIDINSVDNVKDIVDYEECNLANSPSKQSSSPNINPSTLVTSDTSTPIPDTSTPVTPVPTSHTSISTEPDSQDYCKSVSRRHNNHVHKLSTQRLLEQISNPITIELNASAVKGDTNRNPEYKKYKILKKSLRYKNGSGKSKDRKNNTDKRVEVW